MAKKKATKKKAKKAPKVKAALTKTAKVAAKVETISPEQKFIQSRRLYKERQMKDFAKRYPR